MKQFFNYRDFEAMPIMRSEFKPVIIEKLEKLGKWILITLIGVAFTLSVIAITKWLSFDKVYDAGVRDAYRAKNGLKNKTTYAGASGEGRVMNAEDKHGR